MSESRVVVLYVFEERVRPVSPYSRTKRGLVSTLIVKHLLDSFVSTMIIVRILTGTKKVRDNVFVLALVDHQLRITVILPSPQELG